MSVVEEDQLEDARGFVDLSFEGNAGFYDAGNGWYSVAVSIPSLSIV
jgi:hypothetical protein